MIIHVGLQRTGTTFLQREIFPKLYLNYWTGPILEAPKDTELISRRALGGNPMTVPPAEDKRYLMIDRVKKLFPDAKIIIGTREFESWIRSCYREYIKSGGTLYFEDWQKVVNDDFWDHQTYLEYLRVKFDKVFHYPFNWLKKKPDTVIEEMCKFMEVEVPEYDLTPRNPGLNYKQLDMVLRFNRFLPVTDKLSVSRMIHKFKDNFFEAVR